MLSEMRDIFFLRTQNIRSCGWLAVSSISTIDPSHLTGALVGIIERLFSSYQPNANIFGLNITCFASLTLAGSHPLIFTQCGLACVHPLRRQFISHILLIMGGTPFSFATTLGSVSTKVFYSLQVVVKWEQSVYWSNYFVSYSPNNWFWNPPPLCISVTLCTCPCGLHYTGTAQTYIPSVITRDRHLYFNLTALFCDVVLLIWHTRDLLLKTKSLVKEVDRACSLPFW